MEPVMISISAVAAVLYFLTALSVAFVIILQNRDPVKTLSWVVVVLLLPVIGLLAYIVFGQYYRKRQIFHRKEVSDHIRMAGMDGDRDTEDGSAETAPEIMEKQQVIRLVSNNNKTRLTRINRTRILLDGRETFNAIFQSLREARSFIYIESYRLMSDSLGEELKEILIRKAREGLVIKVIYDDVGSWRLSKKYRQELASAGVQIKPFMPVTFPFLTSRINFRNHRKIVIVDGLTGFAGGLNFALKYLQGTPALGPWRDTHLEIRGEAVRSMEKLFALDWYFVSGELISISPVQYPGDTGDCYIQLAHSGPDSDWASIMQAYFYAITTARERIYISTPYFSPNENVLTALLTAALAGVDVRLLLPERSDSAVINWSSRSYVRQLIDAGIQLYFYRKGFNHSKYMIVDDVLSSLGSVNVDYRSFDINFEVTALVYDRPFTRQLTEIFFRDLENSRLVTAEEWEQRPFSEKARESLSRILSPLY